MRLGIVGLGAIAREFVAAADELPDVHVTAVCDLDPVRLAELAGPGVTTFTSHTQLAASGVCDAVVVALPNDLHASVVSDLLAAGLDVCCEKPLTLDPADAERLVALAGTQGRVLRTASHRRFNRHLVELRDRVRATGRAVERVAVRYLEDISEHTGGERWYLDRERCGGGCIVDNGPNAIDMARVVVGSLTLHDATLGDVRQGVEYYAQLTLRSGDGARVDVELDWAYPDGEAKDVVVTMDDGSTLTADMLEGFDAFKSSLRHEYVGILADFAAAVARTRAGEPEQVEPDQEELVRLVRDAAVLGRRKHVRLRMPSKRDVRTNVVRLLFHETLHRGMRLAPAGSACVRAGDIHELVVTRDDVDDAEALIDHIAYVGFLEFTDPAMLTRGDTFWYGEELLGWFAGYDESHLPNHLNLILHGPRLVTAEDLDLRPGDTIVVKEGPQREFRVSSDPGAWANQGGPRG